jgi:hypothetical protein
VKKILNIAGSCIRAIIIAVAGSHMFGLTVVVFYRHIPTFGMDLAQRTAVIKNDELNAGLMYIGLFLVFLVFTSVREYRKYK